MAEDAGDSGISIDDSGTDELKGLSAAGDARGPSAIQSRADLGRELERLRARSGLSLRDLASEISSTSANPIGASALGDWCRGARLPLPSRYDAFRRLLELLDAEDPEAWIDAVVFVRSRADRRKRRRDADERPPYMGLRSFGADDADRFFGRADLVDRAFVQVREVIDDPARPRMFWLVGASGAGKSSLLHAGLVPRLAAAGHSFVHLTPGEHPVDSLVAAAGERLGVDYAEAVEGPRGGGDRFTSARGGTGSGEPALVIVIDQFEELYGACKDGMERREFLDLLHALSEPGSGGGLAIICSLRIDFYREAANDHFLASSLDSAQVLVGALRREQLAEAIVKPAQLADIEVDRHLVNLLVRDLIPSGSTAERHDPGALPLLEHALHEAWIRRTDAKRITVDDYEAAGGIGGAIEASAELVYEQLSAADRELARQTFVRLVQVEGEGLATRRVVSFSELYGLEGGATDNVTLARPRIADIMDEFIKARLLTAQESTVEIVHESLMVAWPRMSAWIDEDRESLRAHRRITDATRAWIEADHDSSMLATGMRLESMLAWDDSASAGLRLNQAEQSFLDASKAQAAAAEQDRRRQTRRLRTLFAVAAISAVLTSALAVLVNDARQDALTARDEALSREVALAARQLSETEPGLAAQLAVAGHAISPTIEARSAVLSFAVQPRSARNLGGSGPTALAALPDGSLTAVSNALDGTVRLITRKNGRLQQAGAIEPNIPDVTVHALALTRDGRFLAIGDTAARITLWNVFDPANPQPAGEPFSGPEDEVERLVTSPDGSELAAAGPGGAVFRWNIDDPTAPRPLTSLASASDTWSITYQEDSRRVAVSNDIGDVELWDVTAGPRRITTLTTSGQPVFSVALSADGGTLAAGSQDGRLYVWDLSESGSPRPVEVTDGIFTSWINAVAFSPDGRYLLAGTSELSLRVWDTTSWTPVAMFPHPAPLTNAVFVDDGRTVVTTSTDGTSRWWDLAAALPVQVDGPVWGVSFDRNGHRLALVSGREARIWDLATGAPGPDSLIHVRGLVGADDGLSGAGALSPDGLLLALGTRSSGDVYLVDVSDPDSPELAVPPLGDGDDLVETVAFSPDGTILAAGGDDSDLRLWTLDSADEPELAAFVDDPEGRVLGLAWSADGRYLAVAASEDVYVFDVSDPADPGLVARLDGFEDEAYAAAFNPDGTVLAVGGPDGSVELWNFSDPAAPERIGESLSDPAARVLDLAFDPGGTRLAAAVADGTTLIWDVTDAESVDLYATLSSSDSSTNQVEFDPATGALASSGSEGRLARWIPNVDHVAQEICANAGRAITRTEWATYLPDVSYSPPC